MVLIVRALILIESYELKALLFKTCLFINID